MELEAANLLLLTIDTCRMNVVFNTISLEYCKKFVTKVN